MCWFDGLPERVDSDPEWKQSYDAQIGGAQRTAERIPIIHVTKADYPRRFASSDWTLEVSLRGRSRPITLETEDACGLGRCLYFYAGRAYRGAGGAGVGGAAFAFGPRCEEGRTGSASPFDTGSVYDGSICCGRLGTPEERIDFVKASIMDLGEWRGEFARFLAAYFKPMQDYMSSEGRPWQPDPDGIFPDRRNGWPAWSLEIRFREGQRILDCVRWCASEADMADFRDWRGPSPSYEQPLWDSLMDRAEVAGGHPDYADRLEQWVLREAF